MVNIPPRKKASFRFIEICTLDHNLYAFCCAVTWVVLELRTNIKANDF